MANSLLTPTEITRESLRVLHQKLNFIGSIHRDYDDAFAKKGAKIGDTLQIRLPNEFTVRTGRNLAAQDVTEESVALTIGTQQGVDLSFFSDELTLDLDRFSERYLEPAMSVLAATMESAAMSMYKDVAKQVNNIGSPATLAKALLGKKYLTDALTPGSPRTANIDTQAMVDLVSDTKGLFQASDEIASQYRDGIMGRTAGFDWYENTLWPTHLSGSDANNCTVNGASQTGAAITIANASSKTFKQGDIVTFAGCFDVHPETKTARTTLKTFTVTADVASGGTTLNISPAIVTTGAKQNVSASPTNSGTITKQSGASAQYGIGMLYHRDAFAFVTADLQMPQGVDFAAREVQDGISMRIIRQYDINTDAFPCRIDVFYGYKTLRQQLACRFANN